MEQGHGTMNRIGRPILAASVGIVLSAFFITPAAQTPDRTASNQGRRHSVRVCACSAHCPARREVARQPQGLA